MLVTKVILIISATDMQHLWHILLVIFGIFKLKSLVTRHILKKAYQRKNNIGHIDTNFLSAF